MLHLDTITLRRRHVFVIEHVTRRMNILGPSPPNQRLAHPTGPQSLHGPRRRRSALPIPHPGPRRQVHRHLRRGVYRHRRQNHLNAGPGTAGQRNCRTLHRQPPPRTPRPHPDHQRAARRNRASSIRASLQRSPAAPHSRPGRSLTTPSRAHHNRDPQRPTKRPARRADPRVSAGRMSFAELLALPRVERPRGERRRTGRQHEARRVRGQREPVRAGSRVTVYVW